VETKAIPDADPNGCYGCGAGHEHGDAGAGHTNGHNRRYVDGNSYRHRYTGGLGHEHPGANVNAGADKRANGHGHTETN